MMLSKNDTLLSSLRAALKQSKIDWPEASSVDCEGLMKLAGEHKVQPLVLEAVYDCPAMKAWDGLALLKRSVRAQVISQNLRSEEFLRLYASLKATGLLPMVVKGIVCRALYPKGDLRQSADEDLYVRPEEFSRACEVLREFGMVFLGQETHDAYELGWLKADTGLYIELHQSLFPTESHALGNFQEFFTDTFSRAQKYEVAPNSHVWSLSPHDHFLYLLLHAYKHFVHSGFGIRQVCDIGLWAQHYGALIDWEHLFDQTSAVRAEKFSEALFQMAHEQLGIEFDLPSCWREKKVDYFPLLTDILCSGIYGSADRNRQHAATVTLNAVEASRSNRRTSLLRTIFPPSSYLKQTYPEVQRQPYLLPWVWCKRLWKYRAEMRRGNNNAVKESLRISHERKKLLQFYEIL